MAPRKPPQTSRICQPIEILLGNGLVIKLQNITAIALAISEAAITISIASQRSLNMFTVTTRPIITNNKLLKNSPSHSQVAPTPSVKVDPTLSKANRVVSAAIVTAKIPDT